MPTDELDSPLRKRGFEVLEEEVDVVLAGVDSVKLDFRLKRQDETYRVLVREARKIDDLVRTMLPRAYTTLEAIGREEPYDDDTPLFVLQTRPFDAEAYERIARYKQKYTPRYEYLMVVEQDDGSLEPRVDTADAFRSFPDQDVVTEEPPTLSYSDLELWLTKVMFYREDPPPNWPIEGPITNPNQLAKQADVSVYTAYTFTDALEAEGYLKNEAPAEFELVNRSDLLEDWREHYRLRHQKFIWGYKLGEDDDNPVDAIRQRLEDMEEEQRDQFIITGSAAQALEDNAGNDDVKTAHVFCLDPTLEFLQENSFREPQGPEDLEIVFWYPTHEESLKRGAIMTDEEVKISDPIQRKLDQPKLNDGESWRHYNWRKIERA